MLISEFDFDISEGAIESTDIGTFSDGTNNVVAGLLQVESEGASTATVTVVIADTTFTLPTLDLSDDGSPTTNRARFKMV
jgi:hypothetical protein